MLLRAPEHSGGSLMSVMKVTLRSVPVTVIGRACPALGAAPGGWSLLGGIGTLRRVRGLCCGVHPAHTWSLPFLPPPVFPSITVFSKELCLDVPEAEQLQLYHLCPQQCFRLHLLQDPLVHLSGDTRRAPLHISNESTGAERGC